MEEDDVRDYEIIYDYEVMLHKNLQNLKQKDMDVSAYTKQFLKLCMKTNIVEDEEEKLARYMNGLKAPIQEELSLHTPSLVNKCY